MLPMINFGQIPTRAHQAKRKKYKTNLETLNLELWVITSNTREGHEYNTKAALMLPTHFHDVDGNLSDHKVGQFGSFLIITIILSHVLN